MFKIKRNTNCRAKERRTALGNKRKQKYNRAGNYQSFRSIKGKPLCRAAPKNALQIKHKAES